LTAGAAIEWFRGIAGNAPQEKLIAEAAAVPAGSGGVVFLPHLANGPPPHPDIHARGAFLGLTQTATPAALYRAVLEGVALQSRLMLDGMTGLPGVGEAGRIRLIGGTSRNPLFLKIKASVFARPLLVVDEPEATALGAALFAGVAAGIYPSFDAAWRAVERKEHPIMPEPEWVERYDRLRSTMFESLPEKLRSTNQAIADLAAS
jgi:xylulokinase